MSISTELEYIQTTTDGEDVVYAAPLEKFESEFSHPRKAVIVGQQALFAFEFEQDEDDDTLRTIGLPQTD